MLNNIDDEFYDRHDGNIRGFSTSNLSIACLEWLPGQVLNLYQSVQLTVATLTYPGLFLAAHQGLRLLLMRSLSSFWTSDQANWYRQSGQTFFQLKRRPLSCWYAHCIFPNSTCSHRSWTFLKKIMSVDSKANDLIQEYRMTELVSTHIQISGA